MKSRKLAFALAMSAISLLTGCGSSGGGDPVPTSNIIGYTTQCTATGCVQVPIYGGTGGCVPITQPIYFAGSGQFMPYYNTTLLATGTIPNSGTYGALAVSASPTTNVGGSVWTSPSGLSMSIGGNGQQASVSGSLTLNPYAQQNIALTMQGSYMPQSYSWAWGSSSFSNPYGTGYGTSSACVSGIAFLLAPYSSVNGVHGYAYLYLNNTQHGYILEMY